MKTKEKRIAELERIVAELRDEVRELRNRPLFYVAPFHYLVPVERPPQPKPYEITWDGITKDKP